MQMLNSELTVFSNKGITCSGLRKSRTDDWTAMWIENEIWRTGQGGT